MEDTLWVAALGPRASEEDLSQWSQRLTNLYSQSWRSYHSWSHIEKLVCLWKEHASHLARPDLVLLTILFHDVVYDPTKPDNEEKSRDLFLEFARETKMSLHDAALVEAYIMWTKSHTKAPTDDSDLNYFLDFDLSILAADRASYQGYAEGIRYEYSAVPWEVYREKRSEILRGFLKTPRLFRVDALHSVWDASARENLQFEIDLLASSPTELAPHP